MGYYAGEEGTHQNFNPTVEKCFLFPYLTHQISSCCVCNQTAFTSKKDYGRGEREAQWALAQRTLHGLHPPDTSDIFGENNNYRELSEIAEQAKRRAEVARSVSYIYIYIY